MLSWPAERPGEGPFGFVLALERELTSRQPEFRSRCGEGATVRTSIHVGPVVAGEIGEFRQKVIFLGDTVNITARTEQFSRDLNAACLASAGALDILICPGLSRPPRSAPFISVERLSQSRCFGLRYRRMPLRLRLLTRNPLEQAVEELAKGTGSEVRFDAIESLHQPDVLRRSPASQ